MIKRFLSCCIALFAVLQVFAINDFTVNGLYYTILGGDSVEVGQNRAVTGDIVIPESVPYQNVNYKVVAIGDSAFCECSGLTSVTISEGVTNIGKYAFRRCINLMNITIPNSVTSIGNYGLSACNSLTSVTIPNSVTSIGKSVFSACNNLTSVTIPNSVTSIGDNAFYGCVRLTSVTIPNSITNIGEYTFYWCHSLTNVTIPNSVTSIGRSVFEYCISLASITIPNSVTSIGGYAFYYCESLTSINIPENVTSINDRTFYGCKSLTSITIPNSVTSIGERAFYGCKSLTSVNIPNGVTSINENTFHGCVGLTSVTIPNSVTSIGDYAFYHCSNLTSVTIPNSVTSIGKHAFYQCSNLTSVTISNNVTSIGDSTFCACMSLTSVTIPSKVTSIGNYAFYYCRNMKEINLHPNTPPILGMDAFGRVGSGVLYVKCGLESLYAEQQWGGFRSFIGSLPYSIEVESSDTNMGNVSIIKQAESCEDFASVEAVPTDGHYFLCWSDGSTENPYTLTLTQDTLLKAEFYAIGTGSGRCGDNLYWTLADGNLFITGSDTMYDYTDGTQPWYSSRDYIRSISFPAEMTTVGDYAFYGCKNITSINIPQNVTTVGEYSFAECSLLSSVTIGAGVTSIGCNAFLNDWSIEEIYCYPYNAPTVCETAFNGMIKNYVYLYVQGDRVRHYQLNPYFTDFDIRAIGAETVPSDDDVVVIPSDRDAQFTWPANGNASSYTLQITKDGEVFCTLVFNEYGQLTGIAFAPARNGEHHPRQAATATTNGWQFTVTGLNEGSAYAYTLDVKDAANNVLNSYNGTFQTTGTPTSIDTPDEIGDGLTPHARKIIENGNVYIFVPDGRKLNMQGAEVK